MIHHHNRHSRPAALFAMVVFVVCGTALAQNGPPPGAPPSDKGPPNGSYTIPPGAGSVPDPANRPDFSGVWGRAEGFTHPDQTKVLPFMTASAAADWKKKIAVHDFRVPWSFCEPPAFPAMLTEFGLPLEILMTRGRVTMLTPDGQIRSIWTDGSRPHDVSPAGTYYGDAVGRWEGQTLVVTTTDLRSDNDVVMGLTAGTDDMKVVERIRLVSPDRLEDRFTVTGPSWLARPYQYTQLFKRYPDLRLGEFVCLSSRNRDNGVTVDLTPPP